MSTIVYLPRRQRSLMAKLAATALVAVAPVFAQDDEETNTAPAPNASATEGNDENSESQPTAEPTRPEENENPPAATSTNSLPEEEEEPEEETSATSAPEPESTTVEEPEPESTTEEEEEPTSTEEEVSTTTAAPTTTDDSDSQPTDAPGLTGLPTLTRGLGIPEYPAATVPPTHHAPFMQHSTAPNGTVFIAVGAILGAICVAVLAWRLIVSAMLHRSVDRAAKQQVDANSKAGFPAPPAPFYKYTDQASTMSLSQARGNRKSRGPIPSANLSQSNLFFSPTAAGQGTAGSRASAYLPSGFYAAGAGNPSHGHSISLTNLRPDSRGHGARESRITPPDSPSFAARRDMSGSSLHLPPQPGQRAPSAYLEDLLADDPSALPPPHSPPSAGPTRSPTNRF